MTFDEVWCDVSFDSLSPHLRCADPVPMILKHQIAGREKTCLRCYGVAIDGRRVIKGNVFYFPLLDFPDVPEPDDYAVLFVGFLEKCVELNDKVKELYHRYLEHDSFVVWVARMSTDGPGPKSLLARPVPIGDKICGIIKPRDVWMPDHVERFFRH